MCGVTGFLATTPRLRGADFQAVARRMSDRLVHRGPDSGDTWVDEAAGVALAHRRLAILDLSPEGAQPMRSESGRFVVSFNGEIYNWAELRDELARLRHVFRGHSDTEVLLAAVEEWGVVGALQRLNGMFAFAVWDREERRLHLARDRMGEKPLYYGWCRGTFLFASELKALLAHPDCDPDIDRGALALFMRHGYIPAPHSIYAGIAKLAPAGMLTVSAGRPGEAPVVRYWSHERAAERGVDSPYRGSAPEAVEELEALLRDAVKLRMQADVPLGAFLSGGVDSSTVVALMQAQSARPVRTFTIGFREDRFNEAEHAKAVARHLGTDHTELYVTAQDALDVIPRLPGLYDEPFADSSQIPTFLLSQLTRRDVTVSLSGDGGDELFCGYARYDLDAIWRRLRRCPAALRVAASRAVHAVPERVLERGLRALARVLPATLSGRHGLQRVQGMADILGLRTPQEIYFRMISGWSQPERVVLDASEPRTILSGSGAVPALPTFADEMMYLDGLTYLPDDILVKVDRASMGVSLEARVPLLDHRVVELAWRFPLALKRREGRTKWALRRVLYRYVPSELVERPKMGFAVPIDSWLRGPLREWVGDLLSEDRVRREGFLEPGVVRVALEDHLSGRRELHYQLWDVLMFQAWLDARRTQARTAWAPAGEARAAS